MSPRSSAKTEPEHKVKLTQGGWSAECSCGWTWDPFAKLHEAEQAAIEHVEESK